MKVILDTNVLVSGIFWGGAPRSILELWAKERIEVAVSPLILKEYERVLAEMERKKQTDLSESWLAFIVRNSILIHPEGTFRLCRDPHDDKFLHCAVSAGANALVSGDKDLLALKKVSETEILTPKAFLRNI